MEIAREFFQVGRRAFPCGLHGAEVAARAEHLARRREQHGADRRIFIDLDRRVHQLAAHLEIQGIGRVGPVQTERGETAVAFEFERVVGRHAETITRFKRPRAAPNGRDRQSSRSSSSPSLGETSRPYASLSSSQRM